jgi:hypothetical protein
MSGGNIEVVLMTTPSSPDSLLQHAALLGTPSYHWLAVDVQSTDSFRKILANYDALGNWKQLLRPTAPLHIVVVTDDAGDLRSADFLAQMPSKALRHRSSRPRFTPSAGAAQRNARDTA